MGSSAPLIRCTPAADQTFVHCVSTAYDRASETMIGGLAIAVMTLIEVRREYPAASLFVMAQPSGARRPLMVWLVSREAWADVHVDRHGSRRSQRAPTTPGERTEYRAVLPYASPLGSVTSFPSQTRRHSR